MPTPIPGTEKTNFINIVKVAPYPGGPNEAERLQDILNNYEDIYTAITRQLELFASNNSYLINAITCFNDNQLQVVGIWVNKTIASPPLADPVLIINSTLQEVVLMLHSPPGYRSLCLLGSSTIEKLTLSAGVTLNELYAGPGSSVNVLNGSLFIAMPLNSPPTVTQKVYLPFLKSTPSSLNAVTYGSVVNQIIADEGSFYGGVQNNDPDAFCDQMVSNVTATEVTKNSVLVSWTPPASYLFINTSYRKSNSKVWIPATSDTGDFVGDTGFEFRNLDSDTFYDVQITTRCLNGGLSKNTITFQTTCCGAGSKMALYKNCAITMLISDTMDSPPGGQVLCNGVVINLHYPPGTTITIPYLASVNANVLQPMVIDNANVQNVPYNPATGTWDFSTTPVQGVNAGSVVTVNVSIPA